MILRVWRARRIIRVRNKNKSPTSFDAGLLTIPDACSMYPAREQSLMCRDNGPKFLPDPRVRVIVAALRAFFSATLSAAHGTLLCEWTPAPEGTRIPVENRAAVLRCTALGWVSQHRQFCRLFSQGVDGAPSQGRGRQRS